MLNHQPWLWCVQIFESKGYLCWLINPFTSRSTPSLFSPRSRVSPGFSGQYWADFSLCISTQLHSITIVSEFSCCTISQKSSTVQSSGPGGGHCQSGCSHPTHPVSECILGQQRRPSPGLRWHKPPCPRGSAAPGFGHMPAHCNTWTNKSSFKTGENLPYTGFPIKSCNVLFGC